jgi:DNA-binding HxlR family transcriptional regulator
MWPTTETISRQERSEAAAHADVCKRVEPILARVGEKWSLLVVMTLSTGPQRFNALRRSVDGISQRMLTVTLRALERDGLVSRTEYPSIPPRVEYALTGVGRSLCAPVIALADWAVDHVDEIESARTTFDERVTAAQRPRTDLRAPPSGGVLRTGRQFGAPLCAAEARKR